MSLIRDKKWCYTKTRHSYPIQKYKTCPEIKTTITDSNLFAVGSTSQNNKLLYTSDGINWSNQDISGIEGKMNTINDIAFYKIDISNAMYVAVGKSEQIAGEKENSILYSYNKKDWFSHDISYSILLWQWL
jgi:hypothetical protein